MNKIIAALVATVFCFGAASVQAKSVNHPVGANASVQAKKAHKSKAHKAKKAHKSKAAHSPR